MKKAAIHIIIAGLFAIFAVQHISGVVCRTPDPPCHEFWHASAVFAGRVISVTDDTEKLNPKEPIKPSDAYSAVHAVFEVSEPFRGVSESKIEVRTGSRGPRIVVGDSVDFRVGQEYIVYAYLSQLRPYLTTSVCSRTRLIANAAEDLAYARSVATSTATGARIIGKVARSTNPEPYKPASAIQISLWLDAKNWTTQTNADGDFEFTGMSAGDYQVLLPSGAKYPASVRDVRGCECVGIILDKLDP